MENTKTTAEYRQEADQYSADREESFQRCDTDGFLSQWASGISSSLASLKADLAERNWMSEFPRLADLEGNIIPDARIITTKFGYRSRSCWMIPQGFGVKPLFCPVASVGINHAWDEQKQEHVPIDAVDEFGYTLKSQKNLAKRGYRQVNISAPAKAVIRGSGRGLSGKAWACVVEAWERD